MDADKPTPSINLAQDELDKARAQYAEDKARKAAQDAAPNSPQPGDKLDAFPGRS